MLSRSVIKGRVCMADLLSTGRVASENLGNRVDRPFGTPVATRYGEDAIQECVLRVPGLEAWRGPEVVRRGVDPLAPRERRDHFRRPVTKPERRHVDEGAVVGLERDAEVELEDAVCAEERPI